MKTPLHNSSTRSSVSCLICGARGIGTCSCWEKCSCGWTKPQGGLCSNTQCPHRAATAEDMREAVSLNDDELQVLAAVCSSDERGAVARRIRLQLDPRQSIHDTKKLLEQMNASGLLIAMGRYYEPSRKGLASLLTVAEENPPPH